MPVCPQSWKLPETTCTSDHSIILSLCPHIQGRCTLCPHIQDLGYQISHDGPGQSSLFCPCLAREYSMGVYLGLLWASLQHFPAMWTGRHLISPSSSVFISPLKGKFHNGRVFLLPCLIHWYIPVKSFNHVQLCNPMDCSLPGAFVHGIFQARILEWVAFPFSRESSWPRDRI